MVLEKKKKCEKLTDRRMDRQTDGQKSNQKKLTWELKRDKYKHNTINTIHGSLTRSWKISPSLCLSCDWRLSIKFVAPPPCRTLSYSVDLLDTGDITKLLSKSSFKYKAHCHWPLSERNVNYSFSVGCQQY